MPLVVPGEQSSEFVRGLCRARRLDSAFLGVPRLGMPNHAPFVLARRGHVPAVRTDIERLNHPRVSFDRGSRRARGQIPHDDRAIVAARQKPAAIPRNGDIQDATQVTVQIRYGRRATHSPLGLTARLSIPSSRPACSRWPYSHPRRRRSRGPKYRNRSRV